MPRGIRPMRWLALILFVLFAGPAVAQNAAPVVIFGANSATAVTKSDTTVYDVPNRGVYNGGAAACDIALKLGADTTAVTFSNVPSGAVLNFSVKQVMSTNTTCANTVLLR